MAWGKGRGGHGAPGAHLKRAGGRTRKGMGAMVFAVELWVWATTRKRGEGMARVGAVVSGRWDGTDARKMGRRDGRAGEKRGAKATHDVDVAARAHKEKDEQEEGALRGRSACQ